MKGRHWYQELDIAERYEDKRFSRGGRLIDNREKEAVMTAIDPIADRSILEIACGTGRFTVMLADLGAKVIGLDISAAMLAHGRKKSGKLGLLPQIEFIRGDAARLPFPDDHFDVVLAMRFFHLLPEPAIFLRELRRVASNQIVFDTFNDRSTRRVYNWLLPMGSRLYSDSEIRSLLETTELEIESVEHDFILPYGVYRGIPRFIADAIYETDNRVSATSIGKSLASVSYWNTKLKR